MDPKILSKNLDLFVTLYYMLLAYPLILVPEKNCFQDFQEKVL